MPTIDRPGGKIHYEIRGSGAPIVILRGLGRTVRHWLGYDAELAKRFQVVTMDLRGVGKSTVAHGWRTTLFDVANDVAAVLSASGIEKAHILGVSLGGMVALATGLAHPERCLSLITVNTSIAGQRMPRMSLGGFLGIAAGLIARDGRLHKNLARAMLGSPSDEATRDRVAKDFAAIAATDGMYIGTIARQLVAAARFGVGKKLRTCRVPTLVIYGTADAFVPPANSRNLARLLPNARLVALEGGGHELTLDKADELTALLSQWISEREGTLAADPAG
jgi:pimeloyl-ACP methyl ester carboxylesterase